WNITDSSPTALLETISAGVPGRIPSYRFDQLSVGYDDTVLAPSRQPFRETRLCRFGSHSRPFRHVAETCHETFPWKDAAIPHLNGCRIVAGNVSCGTIAAPLPHLTMTTFLTVKEAARRIGKSPSSI